jgi:hypothetical protein
MPAKNEQRHDQRNRECRAHDNSQALGVEVHVWPVSVP